MSNHPLYYVEDVIKAAIARRGPLRRMDIIRLCEVSDNGARGAIRRMRARGEVRIAGWQRATNGGKTPTAIYGLGSEPDAVLVRATPAERRAKFYARKRAERAVTAACANVFGAMAQQLTGRAA